MKKLLILVNLATLCITMSWAKDSVKTLTCTYSNHTGDVTSTATDKISYSGKYVTKVNVLLKTIVTATDVSDALIKSTLNDTKINYDNMLKRFSASGINGTTKITKNAAIVNVVVHKNKLSGFYPNLAENGKIKIADARGYYEKNGFTCK